MTRASVLLVNPPMWNVYAPHLAVPLLGGYLRSRGENVRTVDLSIEAIDWLLSPVGLEAIRDRLEARSRRPGPQTDYNLERAFLVIDSTIGKINKARRSLASIDCLAHHEEYRDAVTQIRNSGWCIDAAFPGSKFDLWANDIYYSSRSTDQVLAASADAERNLYRWVFERILPPYLIDSSIGLLGISVSADTQLISAITIARMARKYRPDIHITLGGNYATRMVSRWRERHPFFDFVDDIVCGEGEEPLARLCERELGRDAGRIPGLVEPDRDGGLRREAPGQFPLTESIAPDFSDYPLDKYLAPGPVLPVFASRSCAWSCSFCAIPFASGSYRPRDPETVADEVTGLAHRYGTKYFMFVDEILTLNTLRRMSDSLIERRADIFWYGETRFSQGLDQGLAKRLYQSGCRRLDLGLESYNQRVLDLMKKGTKTDYIGDNIDSLLGAGIPVHLFCMAGFPGETADDVARTEKFVKDIMARSRDAYSNSYSTFVIGPFELDLLSPVAADPSRFGVHLRPVDGEDLALTVSYDCDTGIGTEAATKLAALATARVEAIDFEDTSGFHQGITLDASEEYVFLRCAVQSGLPPRLSRRYSEVASTSGSRELIMVRPSTYTRLSRYSAADGADKASLNLYNAEFDTVWALDPALAPSVGALEEPTTHADAISMFQRTGVLRDGEAASLVEALVRFGFLRGLGTKPGGLRAAEPGWQYRQEFLIEERESVLLCRATGSTVRLNRPMRAAWLLAANGVTPDDPRLTEIAAEEVWERILRRMAELGFLYRAYSA
jgi:Radical SAM superfamily